MLIDSPEFINLKTIDFEKGAFASHGRMFLDANGDHVKSRSIDGILSSGVPGIVKGSTKFTKIRNLTWKRWFIKDQAKRRL